MKSKTKMKWISVLKVNSMKDSQNGNSVAVDAKNNTYWHRIFASFHWSWFHSIDILRLNAISGQCLNGFYILFQIFQWQNTQYLRIYAIIAYDSFFIGTTTAKTPNWWESVRYGSFRTFNCNLSISSMRIIYFSYSFRCSFSFSLSLFMFRFLSVASSE